MKNKLFITWISVVIISYVAFSLVSIKPMLENYTGIFESENVLITLNTEDDNRYGSLSINGFVYSVTAKQIKPGVIEGLADDGENSVPFILSQGKWQVLLPDQYKYSSLEINNKSHSLKHSRITDFDLSGIWRSFGASLEIQKSDDSQWHALLKSDKNEKILLSFKQNGPLISGFFRDNGLNFFTGKYSHDTEQIILTINKREYQFTNELRLVDTSNRMIKSAPYSELMQAFDGVFQLNDTKLSISHRQGENGSNYDKPSICEGRLTILEQGKTIYVPFVSCGIKKNKLWFEYRKNNKLLLATVALATKGVELNLPSQASLNLTRVRKPLLAGRYETANGTIIELLTLKGDIWEGYFHSKGVKYPFKGRFSANRLEGVNLFKGNTIQTFVISSESTDGTIAWNDRKPNPIKLTYTNPNQPHTAEDSKTINKLLNVADVQVAKSQNIVPLQLYWSSQRGDNFVTAAHQHGNANITADYKYVRDEACIFSIQKLGTIPFNLYWNSTRGDYFTTTSKNRASDARVAEYSFVRTVGYIYLTKKTGTIPFNLYWSSTRGDYFTTATNKGASDSIAAGYSFVRKEGYAYPASMCK